MIGIGLRMVDGTGLPIYCPDIRGRIVNSGFIVIVRRAHRGAEIVIGTITVCSNSRGHVSSKCRILTRWVQNLKSATLMDIQDVIVDLLNCRHPILGVRYIYSFHVLPSLI